MTTIINELGRKQRLEHKKLMSQQKLLLEIKTGSVNNHMITNQKVPVLSIKSMHLKGQKIRSGMLNVCLDQSSP